MHIKLLLLSLLLASCSVPQKGTYYKVNTNAFIHGLQDLQMNK